MSTETVLHPPSRPQAPHPAAAFVLQQLTTRFERAAVLALQVETDRGCAAAYLDAFRRWMHSEAPCPVAFRHALIAVHASHVVEVSR